MYFRPLLILFAAVSASLCAEEIRISASDLLADYIREPLENYGQERGIDIQVDSIGSLPAMDRLRSNEIDLAIIAVPEGDAVPREDFSIYPFAYEIAVVAVNASNPIDEISLARLGGIFGANEEFNYRSWGDLGLSGWGNRSIKPLAAEQQDGISLELFKYSVLKGRTMKSSVAVVKDSEVEGLLLSDAASIAILPYLPKDKSLKTLKVSSSAETPAFGPTEDNVHYGDYPIRLAFYLAYNKRDEAQLRAIVRVLLGDEEANNLRENNLFALPDTVRRKLLIDLELEK